MDILLGPFIGTELQLNKLASGEDNIYTFNLFYSCDNGFRTITSLAELLETVNFKPDLLLLYFPENKYLPIDIGNTDIPVVTVFADWNVTDFGYIRRIADISDWILTDLYGVTVFEKLGYRNVSSTQLGHLKSIPAFKETAKDYELTFIGSLDQDYHPRRMQHLFKLLDLGNKYKILFTEGFYGENYYELIRKSKISFNHSIKGEINHRVFEVMINKSLLFMEESNLEMQKQFKPFEHYIPYNHDNLNRLAEKYLNNEVERNRIINNAYREAVKYTEEALLLKLIAEIKELKLKKKRKSLLINGLSEMEKKRAEIIHNILFINPRLFSMPDTAADSLNNFAVVLSATVCKGLVRNKKVSGLLKKIPQFFYKEYEPASITEIATNTFKAVLKLEPAYVQSFINLAILYFSSGKASEAKQELKKVTLALEKGNSSISDSGMTYFSFSNYYRLIYARLLHTAEKEGLKNYFYALAMEITGDIYASESADKQALDYYQQALNCFDTFVHLNFKIGRQLFLTRNYSEACIYLEKYFKEFPFNADNFELYLECLKYCDYKKYTELLVKKEVMERVYKPAIKNNDEL